MPVTQEINSDSVMVDSDLVGQYSNFELVDRVFENGDVADATQPAPEMFLLGFVVANVVGLRYYNGTINGRELLGLCREPLNPYDENAIKVLNTRCIQVGHIERKAAQILAPLIDSGVIRVEGIVPKTLKKENKFKVSCQVHIFTHLDSFEPVKTTILKGGLQLISENNAAFTLSDAMVVKEKQEKTNKETTKDNDLLILLDEKNSEKENLNILEPPKDVISSDLMLHQKEALGWLVHCENPSELPPFWKEKSGFYINVLTNYKTNEKPEPFRGGILADDMGLGKTLTLLSLVAFDKFLAEPYIKKMITGRPKKRAKTEHVDSDQEIEDELISSKTTLVVCPPSVLLSWGSQIEEHVQKGKLKVYMYYGSDRIKDASVLRKYDIVLTTYQTLANDDTSSESPMKKIEWLRIILDEAHFIKNINAQQSKAVTQLNSKRRWVVTGTPIQNHNLELMSLMTFLKLEPFSIKSYWDSLFPRHFVKGERKGLTVLQVLMASICLRRTKDKILINLPSKTVETHIVDFSDDEREVYERMLAKARVLIDTYVSGGRYNPMGCYYTSILGVLVRLRQVCNDCALCPPDIRELFPSLEDVSKNPELMEKLLSVLQEGEDFDCPICLNPPNKMVITRCGHIFCQSCMSKITVNEKIRCPLCRRTLSMEDDLYTTKTKPVDDENTINCPYSSSSSKVTALLNLLLETKTVNPNTKSVIFSQFSQMLILLEKPLKEAGFTITRLDGSMKAKDKRQVIQDFQTGCVSPDGPMILLASLKACGVGINLTAASRVYLFDPWWNPAVEEQAMDRVHRIGQKDDVKVVRLIVRDTIEEKILLLQEQKKRICERAFGGRKGQDQKLTKEDLIVLLS